MRESPGTRYERSVQSELQERFGEAFRADVYFTYTDRHDRPRELAPDGILWLPDRTVVIEIKLKASRFLWFQLRWMLGPLASKCFEGPVCELGISSRIELPIYGAPEQPFITDDPSNVNPTPYWLWCRPA